MTTEEILRGVAGALADAGISGVVLKRLSALDGAEGCVVRPQTSRVVAQYINGAADVEMQVRAVCKRRRAVDAMADAETAADVMDGLVIRGESGAAVLACSGDVCSELELNDNDYTIWEARATALYRKEAE